MRDIIASLALLCVAMIIWAYFTSSDLRGKVATAAYITLSFLIAIPVSIIAFLTLGMASSFGSKPPSFIETVPALLGFTTLVLPSIMLIPAQSCKPTMFLFFLSGFVAVATGLWPLTIGIALLAALWNCTFQIRRDNINY